MATQERVLQLLRQGEIRQLYEAGELFVSDLRYAYKMGWIDIETATAWGEILQDL